MTDLRWLDDLDLWGSDTESAEEELEQDVYHVIEQDKDTNPDDKTRGLGVANLLSDVLPSNFLASADTELAQDDRIDTVTASIERTSLDGITETDVLSVKIQPSDPTLEALNLQVPFGTGATSR